MENDGQDHGPPPMQSFSYGEPKLDIGGAFTKAVFGRSSPSLSDSLDGFSKWIRDWRTSNAFKAMAEASELLSARGLASEDTRELPQGDAFRLFESSSKVDDPRLRTLWAGLIANSLDPGKSVSPRPLLVESLNRMGPREAAMLEFLWSAAVRAENITKDIRKNIAQGGQDYRYSFIKQDEFRNVTVAEYNNIMANCGAAEARHSISHLIREDLITIGGPRPTFRGDSGVFSRKDMVADPNKVASAINSIGEYFNQLLGKSDVNLLDLVKDGRILYQLSSFGRELMDACH